MLKKISFLFLILFCFPSSQAGSLAKNLLKANPAQALVEIITNFSATGSWVAPTGVTSVTYLVVGGGGGGGANICGGGGGGGVLSGTIAVTPGTTYPITVGAGGTGLGNWVTGTGTNGGNSAFNGITALGGGGGGGFQPIAGANGASGGGGGSNGLGAGGGGTGSQGFSGGTGYASGAGGNGTGGGGGGAGGAGASANTPTGGVGLSNSITGAATYYGGGGAGGGVYSASGGLGGGGSADIAGTANTGGGGGCRAGGGSGVVILKYMSVDPCTVSPTPGTVCANGTIYFGSLSAVKYITTPGGCSDMPAGSVSGGSGTTAYANSDFTPASCSGTDAMTKTWNDGTTNYYDIPGVYSIATTAAIGYGATNIDPDFGSVYTNAIVAITTGAQGGYHAAARYCDKLNYGGYTDWYLPNRQELNLMFTNKASIPGLDVSGNYYWTSTEYSANLSSWMQRFTDGMQQVNYKYTAYRVRCVRRL